MNAWDDRDGRNFHVSGLAPKATWIYCSNFYVTQLYWNDGMFFATALIFFPRCSAFCVPTALISAFFALVIEG